MGLIFSFSFIHVYRYIRWILWNKQNCSNFKIFIKNNVFWWFCVNFDEIEIVLFSKREPKWQNVYTLNLFAFWKNKKRFTLDVMHSVYCTHIKNILDSLSDSKFIQWKSDDSFYLDVPQSSPTTVARWMVHVKIVASSKSSWVAFQVGCFAVGSQ